MLTDKECKNAACPGGTKRVRLSDSGGLYLEVAPNDSKRWFWKYRLDGKEKRMALGSYPAVSLKDARLKRDAARQLKASGKDPVQEKKLQSCRGSVGVGAKFKEVALEWFNNQKSEWSEGHASRSLRQLERDLFPWLGERPIREIDGLEILAALRKVEKRGAVETADRGLMLCRQIWAYVAVDGIPDVTRGIKDKLTPYRGTHFGAITDPEKLGELLRASEQYKGGPVVKAALNLAPLLFQRPGELRGAAKSEIDLEAALWTIPPSRMKRGKDGKENGDPHLVPLPTQAVAILRDLYRYTGSSPMVFPGERNHDRPISENSVRTALLTMGYSSDVHTWHGFRATARTMLAERLDFDPLVIEAQLAHAVKDANGRSYNRTQYMEHRRKMMQRWADYLDELKSNAVASDHKVKDFKTYSVFGLLNAGGRFMDDYTPDLAIQFYLELHPEAIESEVREELHREMKKRGMEVPAEKPKDFRYRIPSG